MFLPKGEKTTKSIIDYLCSSHSRNGELSTFRESRGNQSPYCNKQRQWKNSLTELMRKYILSAENRTTRLQKLPAFPALFIPVTQVTLLFLQPCGHAPSSGTCTLFVTQKSMWGPLASFLPRCPVLCDGWGENRSVWVLHVHTAIFTIDNQEGPTV